MKTLKIDKKNINIELVSADVIKPLRIKVLRPDRPKHESDYPDDYSTGSFHFAAIKNKKILCIASFLKEEPPSKYFTPQKKYHSYRLRGMATEPEYQGSGVGSLLMNEALKYLSKSKVELIWCNARSKAVPFYQRLGFKIYSEVFEMEGIGPHHVMAITL